MSRVIFFSGLPKAGKSVTLHGLFNLAKTAGLKFFLERVHPDQEGNWTSESSGGQDAARRIKNSLKDKGEFWSPEFVRHACRSISGLSRCFDSVLADMGGIPSSQNREILAAARAAGAEISAVVLFPQGSDPAVWVDFWRSEGVEPLLLRSNFRGEEFAVEKDRMSKAAWDLLGL